MNFIIRIRNKLIRTFQPILGRMDRYLRHLGARSGIIAALYYLLFDRSFYREQRVFLSGWLRYQSHLRATGSSSPLLRRNIHRLEKGLLMRPRREVFAKDYIGETVDQFVAVVEPLKETAELGPELQWAADVLKTYFDVVGKDPRIDRARAAFDNLSLDRVRSDSELRVPYRRDLSFQPVDFEAFRKLCNHRRSVRWFLPRQVPRELIDQAVEVAAQSPSACNRQPFRFVFVDDQELLRKVVKIPMGTGGYDENIPMMGFVIGQQRNYFSERDRHLIYIDGSLAAMSFVYAAETLHLGTCLINWPDIDFRETLLAEALQLEQDERPIVCIAIGFPDPEGMVARSVKKPLSELRQFNLE